MTISGPVLAALSIKSPHFKAPKAFNGDKTKNNP
jgi:hypothetical protein